MQWGILGTGKIAGKFADGLMAAESQSLAAVGSRNEASAAEFCGRFGGRSFGSYQQLIDDPDIESIYVSLPNSMHHEWTIRAIQGGKHVLCEKPIAANAAEAIEMFAVAEANERTLVEAFMYRCHPAIQQLLKHVRAGAIGDVRLIRSHFTFQRTADQNDVRYQASLAGGALMDVGCYPINFSRAIAGSEPSGVQAFRHEHAFGVEDYAAGAMDFEGKTLAVFTCGMTVQEDRTTYIGGDDGFIRIEDPWFSDGAFDIVREDGTETFNFPADKSPYALEAEAFCRVVAGQSPWIPPDDSIGNMRVLDSIRS